MPKTKGVKSSGGGLSFLWIMLLLYVGGILAGFVLPSFAGAFSDNGWFTGLLTGIIQMALLTVLGFASGGKLGLTTILFGGIIIFVGGIVGGYAAGYLNLSGWFNTILILLVQSLILGFAGFTGRGKPKLK